MAVVYDTTTIKGIEFGRARSDAGFYIERGGQLYKEALFNKDAPREFTETDVKIEEE